MAPQPHRQHVAQNVAERMLIVGRRPVGEREGVGIEHRPAVEDRFDGFEARVVDVACIFALERDADATRAPEWHHHALARLRCTVEQCVRQQIIKNPAQGCKQGDGHYLHGDECQRAPRTAPPAMGRSTRVNSIARRGAGGEITKKHLATVEQGVERGQVGALHGAPIDGAEWLTTVMGG